MLYGSMTVDATARLREFRRSSRLPIAVRAHHLSHVTTEGQSASVVGMQLCVNGTDYAVADIRATGPVHALDEAFRAALFQHYGAYMHHVRSVGFDSHAREENRDIEVGMGVHAVVKIGFVTAVDAAGRFVDLQAANPILAKQQRRETTGQWVRWIAQAESCDSINAVVQALEDGYNYFVTQFLAQPSVAVPAAAAL